MPETVKKAHRRRHAEGHRRCHTFKWNIGPIRLDLNPVVTLLAAILIWAFVAICMIYPDTSYHYMTECKTWITETFTWFYIGSINIWFVFIVIVYFSKYGKMKLGRDDDEPEFSDATYFTMLFAAGIGVGFFYFGVAEPVLHFAYANRFWGRVSDNQRAQDAINITLYHWGVHGWVVYSIVGLALAVVSHRCGLPMTIRSCFFPLLGDRIFGWMGDAIEIIAIVSTMFGVCASLGAGAMTMNSGVHQVFDSVKINTTNQTIIIWFITFFATMSVVSGFKLGIRRLSEVCFALGMFILLVILFYGETFYLLNLYVQSIGYYILNLIQLGFHTDAFAQRENAPDGKEHWIHSQWIHSWTIAYWGWWIAWSPFVGMFIAKISRGRTVRSFINSTLTAPIVFTFLWFVIVGGSGIDMERQAAVKGIECDSLLGGKNSTESDGGLYRLSCRGQSEMYFDLIQQYGHGVGKFLRLVSVLSILLYFVTSSDSGSLVIDCLSANGSPDPTVTQRVFWALTEGATATALLTAGGKNAIDAVLAAAVASGLPFAPILSMMCVSLWRALALEHNGEIAGKERVFSASLLEIIDFPSWRNVERVVIAIVAPWWPAGHAAGKLYRKPPWQYMLIMATLFYAWVLLMILNLVEDGIQYVGWVVLCGFFAYVVRIRGAVRDQSGIPGNIAEDALTVTLVYFLAVDQLDKHMSIEERQKKNDPVHLRNWDNTDDNSIAEEFKMIPPNHYLAEIDYWRHTLMNPNVYKMTRQAEYDSKLVDNELALDEALAELSAYRKTNNSLLAVDCEGVSLSRNGELTVLALATREKAYIFDVFKIGAAVFLGGLREILEDESQGKLTFDCRQDSDALWHQFSVKLAGVLDLQLLEVVHRRGVSAGDRFGRSQYSNEVERINGYKRCLKLYVNDWNMTIAKDSGAQMLKVNPLIWMQRPLSKTLIQYCAVDTIGMFKLYDKMKHLISSSVEKSRMKIASEKYADYYRGKNRRTNDNYEQNAFLPLGIIPEKGRTTFPLANTTCTACKRRFPRQEFSALELRQRDQTCRVCKEVKREDAIYSNRRALGRW